MLKLVLLTAYSLASPFSLITSVSVGAWASPVDTIEACHLQYGDNIEAKPSGKGGGDMYCSNSGGTKYPINFDAYSSNKSKDGAWD